MYHPLFSNLQTSITTLTPSLSECLKVPPSFSPKNPISAPTTPTPPTAPPSLPVRLAPPSEFLRVSPSFSSKKIFHSFSTNYKKLSKKVVKKFAG